MLAVVIDPGVLVSGLISSKTSAPVMLIRLWRQGAFLLFVSPHLLAELEAVLRRPKFSRHVTQYEITSYLSLFNRLAVHFEDPERSEPLTPDPHDDYLIALARAVGADYLISGDKHLTNLVSPNPPVLTPREFLELLRKKG